MRCGGATLTHRRGGEAQKTQPAVNVSNDASNRTLNRVQVVPITSGTERVYRCEAIVSLNGETCPRPTCGLLTARYEFSLD